MIATKLPIGLALLASLAMAACTTTPSPPPSPESLAGDLLSARYAELSRDPERAAERFRAALERRPGDPGLLEGWLRAALTDGDWEQALQAARMARALRIEAETPWAGLTLAADAIRARRFDAARTQLAALNASPLEDLYARTLTAWALAGDRRPDEALRALGLAEAGGSRLAELQAAMILHQAGRSEAALEAYERAQRGARVAILAELQGRLLEKSGQRAEAAGLYQGLLKEAANPAISQALARVEAGGAPPPFQEPGAGAAISLYIIASALLGPEDLDLLLPSLTLVLALDPQQDQARIAMAEAQEEIGDTASALETLAAVEPDGAYGETAGAHAVWILHGAGRAEEALAQAALNGRSGGRVAKLAHADLLREAERWGEADALYSELLAADAEPPSRRWRILFARGAVRERMGRWPEAEADLKGALQLSPGQPEVLNYLGYSWVDQGVRLEEGITLIRQAVAARPDSGAIVDSLGWAYFKLGQYDAALDHLERAARLDPDDPTINDHLGDLYWRLGRKVEARFQWRRALGFKPGEKERVLIEGKLERGLADPG